MHKRPVKRVAMTPETRAILADLRTTREVSSLFATGGEKQVKPLGTGSVYRHKLNNIIRVLSETREELRDLNALLSAQLNPPSENDHA